MTITICLAVVALLGLIALLAGILSTSDWAEPLMALGLFSVALGGFAAVVSNEFDSRNHAVTQMEERYGITINQAAAWSKTPSLWKINGTWYTCYLADPTVKGQDHDLMCGAPATDFVPADRL